MVEAVVQSFRSEQTAEEIEIRFAVLRADGALRQRGRDVERVVHVRVVAQQVAHNGARVCVLEQVAVTPALQLRQRRFDPQAVACQAAIGAMRPRMGAQAMPCAARPVRLQQAERQRSADERVDIEIGRGTQHVDGEVKQGVDAFAAREPLDHNTVREAGLGGAGEGDEARVLRQAEGGKIDRCIHGQLFRAINWSLRSGNPDGT
jgi:hypothetical protein